MNSEVLSEKFGDDYPLLVDVVNSLLFDVSLGNLQYSNRQSEVCDGVPPCWNPCRLSVPLLPLHSKIAADASTKREGTVVTSS